MKFIFEVQNQPFLTKEGVGRLRKIMATFETMVNTTIPEIRVHLQEKE